MMAVARKLWGALVLIWVCLVSALSRVLGRTKKDHSHSAPPPPNGQWKAAGQEGGGDTDWDSWDSIEDFSVKVVPDGSHGDKEEGEDLFKDMEPVIKRSKKILVKTTAASETVNLKKFAVDTGFQPESTELETWSEEGGRGWEEEEEVDLQQTRETLKAQRREERERRRAEMEQLRHQRAHVPTGHLSLGTRVQ